MEEGKVSAIVLWCQCKPWKRFFGRLEKRARGGRHNGGKSFCKRRGYRVWSQNGRGAGVQGTMLQKNEVWTLFGERARAGGGSEKNMTAAG